MDKLLKAVLILIGILAPILSGLAYVSERLNDYVEKDSFLIMINRLERMEQKIDRISERVQR